MELNLEIECPCGSGKTYKHCCSGRVQLPESIEKYEIINEVLAQVVELGSNLLDTSDFQYFCNNSVDQFRLLIDYEKSSFDEMLNSNVGCQLVLEWLLFLAPLPRSIAELKDNLDLAETYSFIDYLCSSEKKLIDSKKVTVSESQEIILKVPVEQVVVDLLRGLSCSKLSMFYYEHKVLNGVCLKDAITGELHYLYDRELLETIPQSEILIGRVVDACNIKSLLSVYSLLPEGGPRSEILQACKKWYELIESDSQFSMNDMQVNLLHILAEYLI